MADVNFDDLIPQNQPQQNQPVDASHDISFDDLIPKNTQPPNTTPSNQTTLPGGLVPTDQTGKPIDINAPQTAQKDDPLTALGNIAKAGMAGAGQAETENLGLSDDTKQYLNKIGLYPDQKNYDPNDVMRNFNQALIDPLAKGADWALRNATLQPLIGGLSKAAGQAAVENDPKNANREGVENEVSGLSNAAMLEMGMVPHMASTPQDMLANAGRDIGNIPLAAQQAVDSAGGMARNIGDAVGSALEPKPLPTDPLDVHQAIGDAYFDAQARVKPKYDFVNQIIGDKTVKAPQLAQHLDRFIADVGDNPMDPQRPVLSKIKQLRETLNDNGTVPVSTLLDLRSSTNAHYNPNSSSGKQTANAALNKVVDSGLDTARSQIPYFDDALKIADSAYVNTVAVPFKENSVLNKFWQPEDAVNHEGLESGRLLELPSETAQRANSLVNGIKNVTQYNAIRRTLPDDVGQGFDMMLLKNMAPGQLASNIGSLMTAHFGHAPSVIKSLIDTLNPQINEQNRPIVDAIKKQNTYTPLEYTKQKIENQFQQLQKKYAASNPTLALPAPKAMPVDSEGNVQYNPAPNQRGEPKNTPFYGDVNLTGASSPNAPDLKAAAARAYAEKYGLPLNAKNQNGNPINISAKDYAQSQKELAQKAYAEKYGLPLNAKNQNGNPINISAKDYAQSQKELAQKAYAEKYGLPYVDTNKKEGGAVSHKQWTSLVRQYGKAAKIKVSQRLDSKAHYRLQQYLRKVGNKND